ncbi:hypothetical protein [Pantoea ananatis]|nr:hypothetical protein [Pantoea ananatis]
MKLLHIECYVVIDDYALAIFKNLIDKKTVKRIVKGVVGVMKCIYLNGDH